MHNNLTAIILAGGLGTRLRKVISDRPKVLAEIEGRPFIFYILDMLKKYSVVTDVVISTGYMGNLLNKEVGADYNRLKIKYSSEDKPLGTGGAIKLASKMINTDYCLVLNGDSYIDCDLNELFLYHKANNSDITIVSKMLDNISRFGSLDIDKKSGVINSFREKEMIHKNGYINAGIYLMNKSLFKTFPYNDQISLEYDMFPNWVINNKILSYISDSDFIDIGTPDSYERAQKYFQNKR